MTTLVLLILWLLVLASLIPVALAETLPAALGWICLSLCSLFAMIVADARLRPARRNAKPAANKKRCGGCREVLRGALSACARCMTPRHKGCATRPCTSATCAGAAS